MQNHSDLPPYGVESVDNAMRILLLLQETESVRVSDCAEALGVARSTAHRLLVTMANRGFVQQARKSRAYSAGPALMEFVFSSAGLHKLRQAARPVMAALSKETDETVNLIVLERAGARFIECVEADRLVRVSDRTGTLLPAHATAGGKVLLAALRPDEVRAYVSDNLRRLTPSTHTDVTAFLEEIEEIAAQGFAVNRGESLEELRAIAVTVTNGNGRPIAALAISVPADRGDISALRRLVPAMQHAANQISRLF